MCGSWLTHLFLKCTTRSRTHSNATGHCRSRRGFTRSLGTESSPKISISERLGENSSELWLTSSANDSVDECTTNSPVSSMLRSVSLGRKAVSHFRNPMEIEIVGGREVTPLKNEKGARLSMPAALRVVTQATGRGTIALNITR